MTILIDDKEAILKKGSSFDYISENRLFTGSDSYTLTMTFPLADCPQNRAIFGNIDRKDVVKEKVVYDCVITHGSFHYTASVLHELYDEVIDTVIDEYKVDISSEANDKFLPAKKRQFAECDHNAWKYYSSPWVLNTLWDKIRTYDTMGSFLNTCRDLKTVIMEYNDSQEQQENMVLIHQIHYVRSVDTYFAFRNTKMVTREGVMVVDREVEPSVTYWVYSRSYAPVPINIFGDRSILGGEDEGKVQEIKMVPAWLDETDAEHGFMLFLQMNNYDETAEDNLGAIDSSRLVNPLPLAIIAQGEKLGVKEYYDKIYLAYWNGSLPQHEVPMPCVDKIMIDAHWQYKQYPFSLRFDSSDAINYPTYNVDLKKKYTFSFLSDRIPNPRAIFRIDGLRYICEKITSTFTEQGLSKKMKGFFYRLY